MPGAKNTLPPVRTRYLQLVFEDPGEAIRAKDALREFAKTEAWGVLARAIKAKRDEVQRRLMNDPPKDSLAHYERAIGQMKALEAVPSILEDIILLGNHAETIIRTDDDQEVA